MTASETAGSPDTVCVSTARANAKQIPHVLLPTGDPIPQLGFGTYKVATNAYETVRSALELGYRHIDTAQMYRNEAEVGRAIKDSCIPREDLFITSKLDNTNHEPAAARASFAQTLRDLQLEYIDLFLIHWPLPTLYGGDIAMPWRELETFYDRGDAKAIGVSNFQPQHLEIILRECDHVPAVNQIESHPYFINQAVHEYNDTLGIVTQAWSPLARGQILDDPVIVRIAEDTGHTPAQVALRWALQRGDIIFPKAATPKRQAENLRLFDFALTDAQMRDISALDRGEAGRTGSHPDTMERLG